MPESHTNFGDLYSNAQSVLLASTRPWPTYAEMMAMPTDEQRALSRIMDTDLAYVDGTLMICACGSMMVAEKRRNRVDPEACWFPVFIADLLHVPDSGQGGRLNLTPEDLKVDVYVPGDWEDYLCLLAMRAETILTRRCS